MAYNTREIIKDKEGNPISQYYNPKTDQYEPLEGSHGANKVLVENNDLSLTPILDKLKQLTGTVLDEENRKSNELERISNENARSVFEKYNSAKHYVVGNKVSYGGSSYVCVKNGSGYNPADTSYWTVIASKGEKGDKGDKGSDGIMIGTEGPFAFMIKQDGNLYLQYLDGGTPPDAYINNKGELILNL